ncbi:MAG: WecB/TagA/CpsF family glycosyltransferase [Clostridia bacterium]|nr:WecB/TagA/CpsF family glycosyltransferase [Clostridia bacterium]
MRTGRTELRGIPLDVLTREEAGRCMEQLLETNGCSVVVTPNCEILYAAEKNAELKTALIGADLAVPDGIGVVKAASMAGSPLKERLAGIDICTDSLKICAQKGMSVFFLGGKPGIAERAAKNMEQQIPGLKVAGTADGYFLPEEEERLVRRISESGAAFAVIGLGSPKQELFMHKNAAHLGVKACMGVGGSLDVWAGEVNRAPEKFTRAGLEWLYRLVQQPSRIKRIVKIPAYLFLVKFTKKT